MKMLLLLLAFVLGSAADDGCLELHPPRVVVRHGDPVSVNCIMSMNHTGIGWSTPGNDVPLTHGVQSLLWRVESLKIWDLRPLCVANCSGKPQCKECLSVTMYKPPDSVSVSTVNSTDSMVEGSQYQLKCEIQNIAPVQNLTVRWYKGDTLVHEDRDYVIEDGKSDIGKAPVNVSSTLLITAKRTDNGTEYSCGAELDLEPEGPQPPLEVKSPPLSITVHSAADDGCLELHPPRVVVRHGDPVSVNCTVSMNHTGIGWSAPVNDVPLTRGVQFLTWKVESLRIWDLKPLCFANRPGKPQCKERLSVTVYKPPDSVSVSSVNSADSMVEGSQYQLKCEIQNIAPVQNLTVRWYKGDTLIHEDRDYVIEGGKSDIEKTPVNVSSTLLITANRADNGAEYSCGAELDLGPEGPQPPLAVKSTPLSITVHYPPEIKERVANVTVAQGGTVSLSCSAEGNPPPQVRWSYRDAGNVRVTSSGGISTAVITEASSANEGVYNCTAINRLGSDTATASVTVTRINMIVGYIVIVLVVILFLIIILVVCTKKKRRGSYSFIAMRQINEPDTNGAVTSRSVANGTQK